MSRPKGTHLAVLMVVLMIIMTAGEEEFERLLMS